MYQSAIIHPADAARVYSELREQVVADYRAKTGSTNTVRIPSAAIRLMDAQRGNWICEGLERGLEYAAHYPRPVRWVIRVSF